MPVGAFSGARLNCFDNVMVTCTAAYIAFKPFPNLVFVWIRVALGKVDCTHNHTRRTKPTLQTMMLTKGFLHRMKSAVLCNALNRYYVASGGLYCKKSAGFYGHTVDMNNTGAALTCVATNMCAR